MKRRKRSLHHRPPPRLEWPAPITSKTNSASSSPSSSTPSVATTSNKSTQPSVLPSILTSFTSSKRKKWKNDESQERRSMLWVDKYAPIHNAKDLCVQPRKVTEVRDWITASLRGSESKMLLLVGSPGIGKSSMCRVLASELNLVVKEWNDSHFNLTSNATIPYQSQLASFEEFLESAGAGFNTLPLNVRGRRGCDVKGRSSQWNDDGALILIEDIPNLHTIQAEEQFRSITSNYIQTTSTPTIYIFSNCPEGKASPSDLEKLFPPSMLYSPKVKILQCNPVTQKMMKKILQSIATKEKLDYMPDETLEIIYENSNGDLRNAIMSLQFRMSNSSTTTGGGGGNGDDGYQRDVKLSAFHALGKLLYAKRVLPNEGYHAVDKIAPNSSRPPLSFHPETVFYQNELSEERALSFLAYHSPEFFTDETELSMAFDRFSDAAMFLDRTYDSQRDRTDAIYPSEYITSLASRSVADANKHPAPNRFRPFTSPKVFDVMRKKRGNDVKMRQLCRRLSMEEQISLELNIGSMNDFVGDFLPFMKTILSHEVYHTLQNLYSYARPSDENTKLQDESFQLKLKEQDTILEMDDILDDEDDDYAEEVNEMHDIFHEKDDLNVNEIVDDKKLSQRVDKTRQTLVMSSVNEEPEIIVIDD